MNNVEELSLDEKIKLTHGDGPWHTNSVGNIPSVMMTDGPHGLRKQSDEASNNDSIPATCFPTACAVGNSWNVENAAKVARCIAEEAQSENVSLVLGPGINIKRSPLCGRNFEYFSEDPCLTGHLAASYVSSMQSRGIGSCLKHFAVNSQETRRMTIDAIVDERALREIYLSAFEYVVKHAHPCAIMASYNKINGVYSTENKRLLTDILRKEWQFDGMVVSDWGATYNTPNAISAGMDLEMPEDLSGYHAATLKCALENGELSAEALNSACKNVENFARKFVPSHSTIKNPSFDHVSVCCEVAADSAVLLKNDGVLPLKKDEDICIIGELAEIPRFQGGGSSHINATCENFFEVLKQNGMSACYAKGYDAYSFEPKKNLEEEAVKLAESHKTVLFFGGLTDAAEGEGFDRSTLQIPQNQQLLLQKLSKVNSNIVFVAFGGSPFEMPWLCNVKALLHMNLAGEEVMRAAFMLIFGEVSPSGRLAETYPLKRRNLFP